MSGTPGGGGKRAQRARQTSFGGHHLVCEGGRTPSVSALGHGLSGRRWRQVGPPPDRWSGWTATTQQSGGGPPAILGRRGLGSGSSRGGTRWTMPPPRAGPSWRPAGTGRGAGWPAGTGAMRWRIFLTGRWRSERIPESGHVHRLGGGSRTGRRMLAAGHQGGIRRRHQPARTARTVELGGQGHSIKPLFGDGGRDGWRRPGAGVDSGGVFVRRTGTEGGER